MLLICVVLAANGCAAHAPRLACTGQTPGIILGNTPEEQAFGPVVAEIRRTEQLLGWQSPGLKQAKELFAKAMSAYADSSLFVSGDYLRGATEILRKEASICADP